LQQRVWQLRQPVADWNIPVQSSYLLKAWNAASRRYLGGYSPQQAMQRLSRRTVGRLLLRATASRTYDLRSTLVIAGSPRSGTTWLAELLNQIPRSAILFEPEHVQQVPQARAAGLTWHTIKDPDDDWPEGEQFFAKVFRGQLITGWTASHVPLGNAVAPRTWIVKFVDANFMLGWLTKRFPIRPPALLIRHPCAVIASQLRRGWSNSHPPRLKGFLAKHPEFTDYLETLSDPAEFAAALWSMQTYAPLSLPKPWPFQLIPYEELATNPGSELSRLFSAWKMPMPDGVLERAIRPSGTTDLDSALRSGSDPSGAWRKSLSPRQIEGILRVIERFGLNFYGEDARPDLSKLYDPGLLRTSA
jgi:hypothetical protein